MSILTWSLTMNRCQYWLLLVRYNGQWEIDFGDYDKKTVQYQLKTLQGGFKRKDLKIVSCDTDDQETINNTVRLINLAESGK